MNIEARTFAKLKVVRLLTATLLTGAVGSTYAQSTEKSADKKDQDPWTISVGGGIISTPDYEGSKKTISGVLPTVSVSYLSKEYGKFGSDPRRGLSWTPVLKDEYSFGVGLGVDFGRKDNANGTVFQPGSKLLAGMGRIKPSAEFNVFGHYTLGVPIYAQFSKGLSDGKINALTREREGHGGARLEVGFDVPWKPTNELTLTFSPNVVWADKKYQQAYFGVTAAQAAASKFKAYSADGGVKSAGLNIGANYQLDKHWAGTMSASINQLRGNAANSPLVSRKGQATLVVGASYTF
jgi:MipA family protein